MTPEQKRALWELLPTGKQFAVVPVGSVLEILFGPLSVDATTLESWSREDPSNYTLASPPPVREEKSQ